MARIRAAVCREFGKPLVIEEVELRAPEGREVEVTLAACAICHSDISFVDGGWGGTLPAVYGHEAAGRITAVGPAVTRLRDRRRGGGDADPRLRHTAPSCATGAPVICATPYDRDHRAAERQPMAARWMHGLSVGAFAEKVVVDQSQIAADPRRHADGRGRRCWPAG